MNCNASNEGNNNSVSSDREKGVVLVIVLWVLVLLGIIVSTYLATIRTDIAIVDNWITSSKARWAVNSAVQLSILKITGKSGDRWTPGDEEHVIVYEGVRLVIRITDEAGKVDINVASEELLQAMFRSVGVSDSTARGLVAEMMRVRVAASQLRGSSAEINAILSASGSSNYYQSIDELSQLELMRPDIMNAIRPLVTVHSRMNGVNPEIAGRDVLKLLPGIKPGQVDEFIAKRDSKNVRDDSLLSAVSPGNIHNSRGLVLNVSVDAYHEDSNTGKASVMVKLDQRRVRGKNRHKKPYTIIEWNEPFAVAAHQSSRIGKELN